jgi:hypothetical protein
MSKFERSWLLFKTSILIIAKNKQLLVFPIVIFALTIVIVLFFIAPVAFQPTGHGYTQAQHWKAVGQSIFSEGAVTEPGQPGTRTSFSQGALIYAAFLYFVSMFCATFFNVAFYHEILAALTGEAVSISRGLKFACTKLKAILMWTLFAGLVGLIIKMLEQKLDFVGRIIARLIGLAWSIAAIFVIPILVRDEQTANPVSVLRKSAGILKRTWGEALIGYAGLTFGNLLVLFASIFILGGAVFASVALNNFWIIAITGVFWLLAIFAFAYLTSVASQIYKGALYLYAAEGTIPAPYNQEMLDMAWKVKKS